eukprot:Skav216315  [mRNA]  locus=scaffold3892:7539:8201:- [translate_table: standard]
MPPKQITIGGGYDAEQLTPEMLQLIEDLRGMTLTEVSNMETNLQNQKYELKIKEDLMKDRLKQLKQEQSAIQAVAKAKTKARARAAALEEKKQGNVSVLTMAMPNGSINRITISKDKTLGKLRKKIIAKSGAFPTVGKKGGILLKDIFLVDVGGNVLGDRPFIYNTRALLGENPKIIAIHKDAFNAEAFEFPTFDLEAPEGEEIEEQDESEGDDTSEEDD